MLIAFDLDGTLLRQNSSFAFCHYLKKQGVFSSLDLLFCFKNYVLYTYGYLSLLELHQRVFQRLFYLKKKDFFIPYVHGFVEENFERMLYLPTFKKLKAFQKQGYPVIILSASPEFLVQPIAKRLQIMEAYGTDYKIDDEGSLRDISNLLDGEKKVSILSHKAMQLNIKQTSAYSDSIVDISLLEAVSIPVVVNPDRRLKKIARSRGWEIL